MNPILSFQRRLTRLWVGAALAGCALFTYAGCDNLDVTNPNAPEPDVVSIQALATGLEGSLRAGMGIYWRSTGILGRELYYFEPADPRYTGELYTGPLDAGGFLLLTPWSSRYRAIAEARTLIEQAESRSLSAEAVAGVRGYANTLIAHQLLLNLNYLGENGIKIEFSDDVATPFVGPDAAYAEIERYLDEAFQELQSAGAGFPFSLSSGFEGFDDPASYAQFNRALRARVAIYQGDADAAAEAVARSFIDAGGDMDLGVYHSFGSGSGDRLNPMFEVPTASFVKLRAAPDFLADAETFTNEDDEEVLDQRVTNKVLDRSEELPDGTEPLAASPASANGLSSAIVVTTAESSSAPYPIIRNEELLLIRAEANILNGNYDAAEDDINAVRAAAGLDEVELDAGNAVDQLLFERRYSLFAEGHRWIDIRRYGRLDTLPTPVVGADIESQIFPQWPRPNSEEPG